MNPTIRNIKHNCIRINIDENITFSIIFGYGTHSMNYDRGSFDMFAEPTATVELMLSCPEKLHKKFEKKYNDYYDGETLFDYLPVSDLIDMLSYAKKYSIKSCQ